MRTLIILGHPDKKSFCGSLADSYEKGAREKGGEVARLNLIDLKFNPILFGEHHHIQTLEPDLVEAQKLIKWANQLVIIFPDWWSAPPALLKGFIDRVFLPGFAFKFREDSDQWARMLTDKKGRIIMTSDSPMTWPYFFSFHPAIHMMKKATLEFCGVSPVAVSCFGSMKNADEKKREGILYKVYRAGLDDN